MENAMINLAARARLLQITDFLPFVGLFSPCRAKKDLQKKEKYHAAAGEQRFCVSPIFL
jgi:hypothetical protein